MLRQGKQGRGIVGSGIVIRGCYRDLHWDRKLAEEGKKANFIRIRLDASLNPDRTGILNVESIDSGELAKV